MQPESVSDEAQRAREAWNAAAPTFDEDADHGLRDPEVRSAWSALLMRLLPPAPARIADLGCGTGSVSVLLAELGHEVTGIDISPRMLELACAKAARSRHRVRFQSGDAQDPRLRAEGFDVVFARHVVWALPRPAEALRHWVDLLAPHGRLVLVEGRWRTGGGLDPLELEDLVRPYVAATRTYPLATPALWGAPIDDVRYALVAER